MSPTGRARPPVRERIAQGFTPVEDVLYVGIGVVLAAAAAAMLVSAATAFARSLAAGAIGGSIGRCRSASTWSRGRWSSATP